MKIGLEIHVQLPTKSKLFCACPTSGDDLPNSRVCPGCLGFPGFKPTLNRKAIEYGLALAKMFGCTIPEASWFSRKTYFYPDLSRHYQGTQFAAPIGSNGTYALGKKKIRIRRVHLEEDPGSIRRVGDGSALIDYNRSGVPLVEIVTEPDLSSPAEARRFLADMLRDVRRTLGMRDDGDRTVRCDCNISVGKERCEVKNVTGLRNVERCLQYEAVRQTRVLKAGGVVERETRNYDEGRKITTSARKKGYEDDYGYIGEPDLGVFRPRAMAESVCATEMSSDIVGRLVGDYGLDPKVAEQIVHTSCRMASLFTTVADATDTETSRYWVMSVASDHKDALDAISDAEFGDVSVIAADLAVKQKAGEITDTECAIRMGCLLGGEDTPECSVARGNLEEIINRLIDENPGVLGDYAKNEKALNRIIGLAMRETRGAYSSSEVVLTAKKLVEARL
ncbi:MAG: Asp-tRNA(Asn)/Glu-tRNA(Gln) amidotransferase subunit GatB [Thermoplasmatales archaeon]|nr:Asp-tRNA(Asn)/Glu-tRNA(Gln) amidotransferase subunit GatB [Thermoplasmatales archaeon]